MKGTCQRCGCTEERACEDGREPCEWLDNQEDLCSRCGKGLFAAAVEPATLADAVLMLRVFRRALYEMGEQFAELRQVVLHIAANQGMIEAGAQPGSEIWTPGDDL